MPKDLFSNQASVYNKFRPVYPLALFEYILKFVEDRQSAWDCATGNGQAALVLADHFSKVFATDISERQLQQARPHEKIEYSISPAEKTVFSENSFDLITVAQAYHWLQFDRFREEVIRVAKPGAIVSVWGYSLVYSPSIQVNTLITHFYSDILGKYWDPERKYIEDHYKTVPFDFFELPPKDFTLEVRWSKDDLTGYLNTWSSLQHFVAENHYNPIDQFKELLNEVWKDEVSIPFTFPLFVRVGKILKTGYLLDAI